jgi:hypothetical protein
VNLGFSVLAEGFMRKGQYENALDATKKLPEGEGKNILVREIRNEATKSGNLELYQEASRLLGMPINEPTDLSIMLLANVRKQSLKDIVMVLDLIPEGKMKIELINTAIIETLDKGSIIIAERLAEKYNRALTKDEAMIAKEVSVREGWISDAERAAKIAGVELSKNDYIIMHVANKDKGLLNEALLTAEKAGLEIGWSSWNALLLAALRHDRSSVWEIAEKF